MPFLLAVAYVAVDHGVIGTLASHWVYNHHDAMQHPWTWAMIHAAFVLAECLAVVAVWRSSEQSRLRADEVLCATGEGIVGLRPDSTIEFANPAAARILGGREQDLVGSRHAELAYPEHVQDLDPYELRLASAGKPVDLEVVSRILPGRKDGVAVLALRDVTQRKRDQAEVVALTKAQEIHIARLREQAAALEREVAQRKATEADLQRKGAELTDFLENSMDGLHQVDANGTILWANKAELAMVGYSASEYVGRNISEFHVDTVNLAELLRRLQAGANVRDHPARMRCRDGSIRNVLISSNVRFDKGTFGATRCVTRDVTDRHRWEEERRLRLENLAESSRRKDEFIAMLAHELRNPLVPIAASVEILERVEDEARRRSVTAVLRRQTQQLTRLVDDLLDVARITRGQLRFEQAPVDLGAVLEEALDMARAQTTEKGQALETSIALTGAAAQGDHARLVQAFANVLHNAHRYTPTNGSIRVHACVVGEEALVTVADDGAGMDPAWIPTLFEPFRRGTPSNANEGLGLGLFLVRTILVAHGGHVEARSPGLGQGSSISIKLPLRAVHATNPVTSSASVTHARVLLVDDSPDILETLSEALRTYGLHVRTASSGLEAIRQASQTEPDIIFLDIGMPGIDGHETMRRLRAQGVSCRLVALSGYAQSTDVARSVEAGADAHLAKPAPVARLLHEVERATTSRRERSPARLLA